MKYFIFGLIIGILIGITGIIWYNLIKEEANYKQSQQISAVWRQEHFVLSPENLINELEAQGLKFPEVIVAQAVLETGHFKSYSCTAHNNLFGLRKKDGTYMRFDHWTDCVAMYKKCIQDWKECPADYYDYLDNLGYAEDSLYIPKLKQIVTNNWSKVDN